MATIEIDGKQIEVESGKMVIEVADEAGISIPRFCYHKKLSVAANCRMCLVEVEKIPKPMPACATPVTDGMKVYTKSKMALAAQKAVMEFLLINHPLDCPICDQGGECELQDVSLGYGKDVSQFTEGKRVVDDEDLGSLISTEMTRCIHCTRCVRFGEEVAGIRELGATGRGENMRIGTYIKHSITSEVSGNVIDLCPVGALTSKPYRFTSRAWELNERKSIAAHDCLGSNTRVHVRREQLMRVVPRENEEVNETWISDRDRFSYPGTKEERLTKPMLKKNGNWHEVDWQEALFAAVEGIKKVIDKHGASKFAAFCSPQTTTEEAYLLQKWLRGLGVNNLDHRLHQVDFADSDVLPMAPINQYPLGDIANEKAVLILGSNVQREQPLLGLRVRKASLAGSRVCALNVVDYDFNFDVSHKDISTPHDFPYRLMAVVKALVEGSKLQDNERALLEGINVDDNALAIANDLKEAGSFAIILGAVSANHPKASLIRSLVHLVQKYFDVKVYRMSEGANEAGCHIAGMLPHREACGGKTEEQGLDIQAAIAEKLPGYLLHQIEAEFDIENPHKAHQSLLGAEFVVLLSSYQTDTMLDYADVLLPVSTPFETSGTFVNVQGDWQSFKGVLSASDDVRPAWKVLRVLGNLSDLDGFEYSQSDEVLAEIKGQFETTERVYYPWFEPKNEAYQPLEGLIRIGEWPMYRIDSICRRSKPLQESAANDKPVVRLHSKTAKAFNLKKSVSVSQGAIEITLPLEVDDRIPEGAVYIANAWLECSDLGHSYAALSVK